MKKLTTTLLSVTLLFGARSSFAQGTFVNLNFESTTLSPNGPPGSVPIAAGLPGWSGVIGGTNQSTIYYNNGTLGSSAISILGTSNGLTPIIDGSFSVMIQAGANPAGGNPVNTAADVSLSQTGVVPANAQSILFNAYYQAGGSQTLSVAMNGQALSLVPLGGALYGGSILSGLAGQPAELTFTLTSTYPQDFRIAVLDSILFSAQPIPEPSVAGLSALGLGLLGWCWRKRTRP